MDFSDEDKDLYDAIQMSLLDYNTQKLEHYHKRGAQHKLEDIEELFNQPLWVIKDRIFMNHENRAKYLIAMRQEAKRGFEEKVAKQESQKMCHK